MGGGGGGVILQIKNYNLSDNYKQKIAKKK